MITILLEAVRHAIGLPTFELNWNLLFKCISCVADEAFAMENQILSDRMTEMGLHKHAHELSLIITSQRTFLKGVCDDWRRQSKLSWDAVIDTQLLRLRESANQFEKSNRRRQSTWSRVWLELANERGLLLS